MGRRSEKRKVKSEQTVNQILTCSLRLAAYSQKTQNSKS